MDFENFGPGGDGPNKGDNDEIVYESIGIRAEGSGMEVIDEDDEDMSQGADDIDEETRNLYKSITRELLG
jgi:hypothetical protein